MLTVLYQGLSGSLGRCLGISIEGRAVGGTEGMNFVLGRGEGGV